MKRLLLVLALLGSTSSFAQLTPNGNSGSSTTAYTNGASNDPIYIWCGNTLGAQQGSLTVTPTSGTGPYTFDWYYHDQTTSSWQPYTTQNGATSTINGLPSDGYRCEVRDISNAIVDCYIAWVWNLNTAVTANNSGSGCNNATLSGTVNTTGSFSYYNPPPPESIINASTQIQVCFSANHTYVSDLAFYLVGPASCGSPTILLSPNPGAIGQGSVCNGGNNVNNLCFTSTAASNLNVCTASAPLTGTYSSYGPSSTAINWGGLMGCNAAAGGWRVQIYDCISLDVGSLTNANITFSNLTSVCGSPTSISYTSGAINSAINDNSCSAGTASIFQVPVSPALNTPITINAATSLLWTANPAIAITNATTTSASVAGLPAGTTDFTLTATTTYGAVSCNSDATTSINLVMPTVDAGVDQTACNGSSVTLSGSGAVSYTWDNGVSNGVAFTPGATTTYTVTGTDANGCTDTDQVTVNVSSSPTIDAGTDQSICPGGSVTLSGSGGVSYNWNNGITDGVSFTPGSTTTYTVTGSDIAGCTNTDQVTVTVYALPAVDAGAPQAICPGGTVTLSGSGATSYSWDNGVSDGVSFNPGSTTTYTVTGTDGNGCQNTDQVTVTVNSLPVVDAGAPQSVCAGGTVTLNGSGATSYTWDNGVSNGVAFVPASTTTFTVTGTDGAGCQNTDQVTVTVNALPVVDAGAPQTVCAGVSVTLNGSGATSYVWTGGVTNGVSFTPAATTIYTVTGTDANGCQNTDQVTVTVNALPAVDAGAPQAVCAGTAVTLNGSGAASYVWNNGVTNGVAFTPGSTTTYTVTGTDANGCQNTDQVTVTVNALPNVTAGADQSVCAGGSVTVNGSGASSYAWDNGVTNGVAFTPGTTTTYTVTGTDGNGCTDTDQMIVTVNALPTVNAGADQTICLGSSVTLSGSGATSYSWTNGVSNNVSFNPALGTVTYTVTGTDANGCQNTDQVVVTVVPVPVADINSAGPLSGYPGLQVVFTNGSQLSTSYDVDFDNGQTASSTNLADTYTGTFDAPGTYTVVLTASNGICTDTDQMDVIIIPYEPLGVHIPNVFTPDGDGVNDEFFIDVENGATIDVLIVNRWENVIMNITDFATHWDGMVNGNEASEGTYFFKYSITGLDGTTQTGQGFVELIRK